MPDPQDPDTFTRSKLNWDEIKTGDHTRLRQLYQALIALRHTEPDLADPWLDHMAVDFDENQQWILLRRGALIIACNLGTDTVTVPYERLFHRGDASAFPILSQASAEV